MDARYEAFCLADPVFYDSPSLPQARGPDFAAAARPVPEGWVRAEQEDWLMLAPLDSALPVQGWKIHASASLDDAEEVLDAVWDHCVARGIPFKFVRGKRLLMLRNGKQADRSGSGKLATIYPVDEAQLEGVLGELGSALDGTPGPYVLSDLRFGDGPLYVRYGGFTRRTCLAPNGEAVPAIEDGEGRLVPDRRGTTFEVPPWVALPDFLEAHLAARRASTVNDMPYAIDRALHFSNGGGLYLGTDRRTGEQVLLKEARPHAGLSLDGDDAVARLHRERDMLDRLAGLEAFPAVRDLFTLEGHHFLVRDFIEGSSLNSELVRRYPLLRREAADRELAGYTAWALEMVDRVECAVAEAHGRGVVIGDLHPANALVRPDGGVALIDLELAAHVSEGRRPALGAPGFAAPGDRHGLDLDRYALASLRLHMFMPLAPLVALDPTKARQLVEEIEALFPVPPELLREALDTLEGSGEPPAAKPAPRLGSEPADWRAARDSLAEAIVASATPEREDRLFPGDPAQFAPGGALNLAHGAAGALLALDSSGAGRHPELEEWLLRGAANPPPGTPLGVYDGLHGVAYALEHLGHREAALALIDRCLESRGPGEPVGLGLFGGLSGIGLNLAHFAAITGDAWLLDAARSVADTVADRLTGPVADVSGGDQPYAGLMRGSSGPALLFIRLFEQTGDTAPLDLARTALGHDLDRCVQTESSGLQVNEGWRTMPYLADGSVGIGMVLADYLSHREDDRFSRAWAAIREAAEAEFLIEPGLFRGRAGMIAHLARTLPPEHPGVARQVRRLAWHAVRRRGHLAFPGHGLLRLSMDLASGTAGVLLALGAALHEDGAHLPFLGPLRAQRVTGGDGVVVASEGRPA